MAISSTGVGSGLDVNNIVNSLMALEKRPLAMLQSKAHTVQTKLSAFGSLKSQIASLGDLAKRLADPANWNPLRSDSSDSAVLAVSAGPKAVAGKYSLEVQQLAQTQALASSGFGAADAVVGTGSLTLELGTTESGVFTAKAGSSPVVVPIGTANQTLAGVRDAINGAKAGITASIVTSGGTARLVLRSADGAENSMRITAADDDGNHGDAAGLSALAWDPAAAPGAGRNLSQTQAAQDAKFTLNGLALTSATNAPTHVVEGLTLTFKRTTTAPVEVNVAVDTTAVRKNVNDFVSAYNSLNKLLQQQTQADPSGATRGPLQADSTATNVLSSLREMLRGTVTGMGGADSLNAAGIELQRDGSLSVKDTRFTPLLETPAKLAQLFSQPLAGSDNHSRGFAVRFQKWAADLTADTGTLTSRTEGLSQTIKANQQQQDAQQAKLARTEAKLRAQYQRLDSNMSSLNGQMARLRAALGLDSN